MQIYIIRHGIAALRETWDKPDEERPLTKKGRKKTRQIARGLRAMGVQPTRLYTSPLLRALETAEIMKKRLKLEHLQETELLSGDAEPAAMIPLLNEHDNDAAIALVGHEPHLSELLCYLLAGDDRYFATFKKGGVALIEGEAPIKPGSLMLRWLLEPNQLIAIG